MAYGTVNADIIQSSVSGVSLGAGNSSLLKNKIINGSMVIDQRNAGASVTPPTNTSYSVDRWQTYASQASKFTIQQNAGSVTPPVGFTNYLGVTSLSSYSVTATDEFLLRQPIEGYNIADLGWGTANAKTVTLSFQVYSSLTGNFGGAILNSTGLRCYPFSFTIPSANTWTSVSITIVGDTSGTWLKTNSTGLYCGFSLGVGSTYGSGTAGAWTGTYADCPTGSVSIVGTNGATFYITGVQLEVGSSATGFEYVNYQTSLANCQRYYQKYQTGTGGYGGFAVGRQTTTSAARLWATYPQMRSTPTLSIGGVVIVDVPSGSAGALTLGTQYLSPNSGFFDVTGTIGGAIGYGCALQFSSSTGYADLTAEL